MKTVCVTEDAAKHTHTDTRPHDKQHDKQGVDKQPGLRLLQQSIWGKDREIY